MHNTWKQNIYLQREQLAKVLDAPLKRLAAACASKWPDRDALNQVMIDHFSQVPHCTYLYCLDEHAVQISDNVDAHGVVTGHYGRDRTRRPYMREQVPPWGFLLSDAYISLLKRRPSITALRWVMEEERKLGYLGADFDLRNLPVTSALYDEPDSWRQIKGDPVIRGQVFQQQRIDSPMDRHIEQALSILDEMLSERGVFQCHIHFSSSQAILWTMDNPYRYRIFDHEALSDPDICMVYPHQPYPRDALIPQPDVSRILEQLKHLRLTDQTIYLRNASINLFNGMISLTFSCDGSHYIPHAEFLQKGSDFWF